MSALLARLSALLWAERATPCPEALRATWEALYDAEPDSAREQAAWLAYQRGSL